MKKRRIHTTLDEDSYRILQRYEGQIGAKNIVLEKALKNLDKTYYKAKVGLKNFNVVMKRTKSGVPGFDSLIEGGIPEGFVVVATGPPGTGKTTFALQFLKEGAETQERGLYFSFEENAEQLARHALRFGWNLKRYMDEGQIEIFGFSLLTSEEVVEILQSYKPKRVVFDSINVFTEFDNFRRGASWRNLLRVIKEMEITCFIVTEKGHGLEKKDFDAYDFMADGIVFMDRIVTEKENLSLIAVKKMRATKVDGRPRLFQFTETGLRVSDISPLLERHS